MCKQTTAAASVYKALQQAVRDLAVNVQAVCKEPEGVTLYATVAVAQQVFAHVLTVLNATNVEPSGLNELAAATGYEDVSVNFTHMQASVYMCTCFSS